MKSRLKHIIWDWNGTMLNDLNICILAVNKMLTRRQLPLMTESRYKEIFTFPIRHYYEAAGFDFSVEPFEEPAEEFIVEYKALMQSAELFPDVKESLQHYHKQGISQYVLSAMEQHALRLALIDHGIMDYFIDVVGIADNYAVSKLDRGMTLMQSQQLSTNDTVMIGDTLHDVEVADKLGLPIILIGRGHQHLKRLKQTGKPILNNLSELKDYISYNSW